MEEKKHKWLHWTDKEEAVEFEIDEAKYYKSD
jgi:hypothetical protein